MQNHFIIKCPGDFYSHHFSLGLSSLFFFLYYQICKIESSRQATKEKLLHPTLLRPKKKPAPPPSYLTEPVSLADKRRINRTAHDYLHNT